MKQPAPKSKSQAATATALKTDARTALNESSRLREYEKVVEGLEDLIAVVDRDYRYVIANRALLKYRNRTLDQIIGRTVREVIGADTFDKVVKKRLDECFSGKTVTFVWKINYPKI